MSNTLVLQDANTIYTDGTDDITTVSGGGLLATVYGAGSFPGTSSFPLAFATDASFLASLQDTGHGSVTFNIDEGGVIAPGDFIVYDILDDSGTPTRAFVQMCQSFTRNRINRDEDGGQTMTWEGPGHLGVLKWGVLLPPGGIANKPVIDDIIFDWTHPEFDDSAWISATEVISVENAQVPGAWGFGQSWATDMPNNTLGGVGTGSTFVLWASDGTTGGTTTQIGDCYFRDTFTVSAQPSGGHILFFTCDNTGEVWIDGKQICTAGTGGNPVTSGFRNATIVPVELSIGTHTIAIKGTNFPPFGAPNPGGVACNIFVPDYPITGPDVVFETTSAMKVKEYPAEPPGMTPGMVMRLALEAIQDIGPLGFIGLGFDDDTDTDSNAWSVTPTISSKVGTDLSTFFKEIAATYADMEMDPNGWTLNAWNIAAKGGASGVSLEEAFGDDPTSGNLVNLTQKGEDTIADWLLERYKDGWTFDTTGTTRAAFLELGPQPIDEVHRLGAGQLGIFANPREEIAGQYEPRDDSEKPWVNTNLVLGSTVSVPDSSEVSSAQRVVELGVSQTQQEERLLVTITLKDPILDEQERFVQEMKR